MYLKNMNEYNLLMKIDTNTCGNTHWFMFRVTDFGLDQSYTFHILNMTRNLDHFYANGMNIVVRKQRKQRLRYDEENKSDQSFDASPKADEWEYETCKDVQFHQNPELVRRTRRNPETGESMSYVYYNQLSFTYHFKKEDKDNLITFAYAVPYGYTDLLKDLSKAKNSLIFSDLHGKADFKPLISRPVVTDTIEQGDDKDKRN